MSVLYTEGNIVTYHRIRLGAAQLRAAVAYIDGATACMNDVLPIELAEEVIGYATWEIEL